MKSTVFAVGLQPGEAHALGLFTLKQLREAVGTKNLP